MGTGKHVRAFGIAMALMGSGCSPTLEQGTVKSADPLLKVPAIQSAVNERNHADEGQMVADLDSDDAAIRFYSIQGLQRLTGDTLGYTYYDDDVRRRPAVLRWKAWLSSRRASEAARLTADQNNGSGKSSTSSGWVTGK